METQVPHDWDLCQLFVFPSPLSLGSQESLRNVTGTPPRGGGGSARLWLPHPNCKQLTHTVTKTAFINKIILRLGKKFGRTRIFYTSGGNEKVQPLCETIGQFLINV